MKVKVDTVSAVEKKLDISIPEERVASEIEQAYGRLAKKASIPGFRTGKVPRNILEQRFGQSVEEDVYQNLLQTSISDAIVENKLPAIRVYDVDEPKREKGKGFSYTAKIEIKPEFEPKDYTGVSVPSIKADVKKEQIQEVLTRLQDSQSVLKHREGATKPVKGDFAALTLQEADEEGNPKPTKEEPKEQTHEIGSEALQPEIEKAICALKVDESKVISVKLQNPDREVKAFVTLKAIKEKILPTLDDAFAKTLGPFENAKALKEQVTKDLQAENEQKAKSETIRKILDEIIKKNPLMLPESLVHDELHHMIDSFKQRMTQMGMQKLPEDYTEEKLHNEFRPEAEKHVHEQLLLEAIADKEKISVSNEDVTEKIKGMAEASKVPPAEVRAHYEKDGKIENLRFQMVAHKTLDFLLGQANVK